MIYVFQSSVYDAPVDIEVVIDGPNGLDMESLFNEWWKREIVARIGPVPKAPECGAPEEEKQKYNVDYKIYYERYWALIKNVMIPKCGMNPGDGWNEIFATHLCNEHGCSKVEFKSFCANDLDKE